MYRREAIIGEKRFALAESSLKLQSKKNCCLDILKHTLYLVDPRPRNRMEAQVLHEENVSYPSRYAPEVDVERFIESERRFVQYQQAGEHEKAVHALESVLRQNKDFVQNLESTLLSSLFEKLAVGYNTLGMKFLKLGKTDLSLRYFQKSEVVTDPANLHIHQNTRLVLRAVTYNNLGCFYKSMNKLHTALHLRGGSTHFPGDCSGGGGGLVGPPCIWSLVWLAYGVACILLCSVRLMFCVVFCLVGGQMVLLSPREHSQDKATARIQQERGAGLEWSRILSSISILVLGLGKRRSIYLPETNAAENGFSFSTSLSSPPSTGRSGRAARRTRCWRTGSRSASCWKRPSRARTSSKTSGTCAGN